MADKYPGISPYNYTANNPLRFIDPTGMAYMPAEPADTPEERKRKEKLNQDEANAKSAGKSSKSDQKSTQGTDNFLILGLSLSGAYYIIGGNAEVGLAVSTKTGDAKFFVKTGMSMGVGAGSSLEITDQWNTSWEQFESGNGFGGEAGGNLYEIEVGGAYGGINLVFDPKYPKGLGRLTEIGGNIGPGAGVLFNFTNYAKTSPKFNLIDAVRKVAENPRSAFWKR